MMQLLKIACSDGSNYRSNVQLRSLARVFFDRPENGFQDTRANYPLLLTLGKFSSQLHCKFQTNYCSSPNDGFERKQDTMTELKTLLDRPTKKKSLSMHTIQTMIDASFSRNTIQALCLNGLHWPPFPLTTK